MADLFNIGLSGLRASQTQLSVTGQNITNINTPGYTRQTAVQTARDPSFTGAGYIGNGTSIVDVQRVYNQFLTNQVRASTSINSEAVAFRSQIEELNGLLSSKATGINPALQSYFGALQTAIEDPASLPARQLFVSEAEGLASKFNTAFERLSVQNQFINQQMNTLSEQVNRLATSIASFNDSIARAAANGAAPNDLLDSRDEAVRKLSELIGVTVVPQDSNSINLFIGSGQPLVVGNQASSLATAPGRADPNRIDLLLVSGGSRQDVTSLISGGELGGLVRYRQEVLDGSINALGRMALSVASEFNRQLSQGLDLNGQPGANLFRDINSPDQMSLRSLARATNSEPLAQVNVSITDTGALTTSDYEITFVEPEPPSGPARYTLRRLSDNQVSGPINVGQTVDGFRIDPLAAPATQPSVGDRFLVMPTRTGAAAIDVVMKDPRQLGFAVPVSLQQSLDNRGTAVVSQPTLVAGPEPIALTALNGFLPVTFTYDQASGRLNATNAGGPVDLEIANPAFATDPLAPQTITVQSLPMPGQLNFSINGYRFAMSGSGTPADGDVFTVGFNTGTSDNRNALQLAKLQTAPVLGKGNGGNGFSLLDGYGDLVQRVATLTAQSRSESEASAAVLKQATNNRDSVSAVNLDEEATNLIKFEQYYNASAQVIQVARSMFDTLISSIR